MSSATNAKARPNGSHPPLPVLGIDVCKDRLDLAYSDGHTPEPLTFDNAGLKTLLQLIALRPLALVVVESTGGIEQPLLDTLLDAGIPVARVQPGRVRNYARAIGRSAKTDRIDAALLAEFGACVKTRVLEKCSENQAELDALVTTRAGLLITVTQQENRLRTLRSKPAIKSLQKVVKTIKSEIDTLNKRIRSLIESDEDFKDDDRLLQTVPGVGVGLVSVVLSSFRELGTMTHNKASALLGVAPFNHDSGRHEGKRHIRGGRSDVRKSFYMSALVAMRHNPVLRTFAERKHAEGKPWKVVIVACMRKLVGYLNTMLKHRLVWDQLDVVKKLHATPST